MKKIWKATAVCMVIFILTGCSSREDKEQYLQPSGLEPLRITIVDFETPEETASPEDTNPAEEQADPASSEPAEEPTAPSEPTEESAAPSESMEPTETATPIPSLPDIEAPEESTASSEPLPEETVEEMPTD